VDDALVTELETAIADTGALLVRAQKYRRGAGPEGAALLREALALGDAARRLHRQEALDAAAARRLLAEAHALAARVRTLLAAIREAPAYRTAVAAHAAGDQARLAGALPAIFAGLEAVARPPDLFSPLAWLRRGRPRAVADIVAEVTQACAEGLAAEGDDLSPGADAELPAVTLAGERPADEPLALRLPAATLKAPVYRLADTGEYLVYIPRLRAPLAVLLSTELRIDEQLRVESAPSDYERYRADLRAALVAAGITVEDA
jgi:hypothetical protein